MGVTFEDGCGNRLGDATCFGRSGEELEIVFGGAPDAQTASGVVLEHFVRHTRTPFPLQGQSQGHLWRNEGPCPPEEVDRHLQVRSPQKLLRIW